MFFGVVMEGEGARALVRGPSNENLRLRVGETVGEWVVKDITRRRLVLTLGEREESFSLFDKARAPQPRIVAAPRRSNKPETAPNTGYLYEGRVASRPPSQPAPDEPEL
jgi:hypothetical protein